LFPKDYKFVGLIHDECQIAVRKDLADQVGEVCLRAAEKCVDDFKFKCPLKAEYKVGESWAMTH
jgi:DNA polymerase-1